MNMQTPTPFPTPALAAEQVAFDRRELGVILGLYGRMVSAGEWRDYAMSFLKDAAVFAVFRRTAEHPLYRIEKRPRLRARQGQYAVIGMDGQVLKRGHELAVVLRVLERKLIRAVE
jgi:protoheme ferro-lyase